MSTDALLEVSDLAIQFGRGEQLVRAVDGVSFDVEAGETVVLVGESGSGKSLSALAIPRLLPAAARIERGHVKLAGENLLKLPE